MIQKGRPSLGEEKIVNFGDFTAPVKYKRAIQELADATGLEKHHFFREALKEYLVSHNIEFFLERENAEVQRHTENIRKLHEGIGAQRQACRNHAEAYLKKNIREMMWTRQTISKSKLCKLAADKTRADRADVDRLFDEIYASLKAKYS